MLAEVRSKPPCLPQVTGETNTDILKSWPAFFFFSPSSKIFYTCGATVSLLSKHVGAVLPWNKERLCVPARHSMARGWWGGGHLALVAVVRSGGLDVHFTRWRRIETVLSDTDSKQKEGFSPCLCV